MMLLAVLAVQALDALVLYLVIPRAIKVHSGHWLAETAKDAALTIFQTDPKARAAVSARFGADHHLNIRWQAEEDAVTPGSHGRSRPLLERARAAIERDLDGKVRRVAVRGLIGLRGNELHIDVEFQPPDFAERLGLGVLGPEDRDFPILGPFQLAIQGLDGSWITVEAEGAVSLRTRLQAWLITLLGSAVLISMLSIFTARKSLRPLDRLAAAARNFGRTRKAVPIDPAGLREFAVIARAMNEMQERIKGFLDERTQMLAAMSHDLRTGLTGLRLDAEEAAGGEAKDRLIRGMEEMERMISATLDFAGDELKGEPLQKIDLAVLVIGICDVFSDRGFDAAYSGPDHFFAVCQPVAIKRALSNLIDNAIKYGGCARVEFSHSGGQAKISIADDGPGIPPDKIKLAFKPFQRLESSRNRETGGVGLGLTIARDIILSHGGEISLGVPQEGRGLEVRVLLPERSFRYAESREPVIPDPVE
jgi:signal transduction histidine kinase